MAEISRSTPFPEIHPGHSHSNSESDLAFHSDAYYADAADTDKVATPSDKQLSAPLQQLKTTYGVDVREVNGMSEFYFRAGGEDNVVLRKPAGEQALKTAPAELDKIVQERVAKIEDTYKVKFAKPREYIGPQIVENSDCAEVEGDKMYSRQATLPVLFGIEEGLSHSWPSQMIAGGKEGVKIYLTDRQPLPDFYGGRKVQGVFRFSDKDKHPAVLLTPATQALGATDKDVAPGARNIAWVTAHEVAHNSQSLNWPGKTPDDVADKMGWDKFTNSKGQSGYVFLKGKGGDLYINGRDSCKEPTTWFSISKQGWPLTAKGEPTPSVGTAAHFSNEQMMDRAKVRPSTFYFMSPYEEMAEALSFYRLGPETRTKLYKSSPKLYELTEEYDRNELAKFYGTNEASQPNVVRTPDGKIVARDDVSVAAVNRFETEIRRNSTAAAKAADTSHSGTIYGIISKALKW